MSGGLIFPWKCKWQKGFINGYCFPKGSDFLCCLGFFSKSLGIHYIHTPELVIHIDFIYFCLPAHCKLITCQESPLLTQKGTGEIQFLFYNKVLYSYEMFLIGKTK